jgi:integrase
MWWGVSSDRDDQPRFYCVVQGSSGGEDVRLLDFPQRSSIVRVRLAVRWKDVELENQTVLDCLLKSCGIPSKMWDVMREVESRGRKPRGRHPERRLTPVGIRAIKAVGRHADGNGLYLVVDPSGSKRWVLRTVVCGKRCDLGLGGLALVGLSEAREEARLLRARARKGIDVLSERRTKRLTVPTFEEAAREVHAQHGAAFRNDKHRAQWLASLEADVFTVFGGRRVDEVTTADVLKALTPIWTAKPETARRLRQRIKVVLAWAKASGFRSGDNPVDGLGTVLPKQDSEKKHHAALPYQGVPKFIAAVRASDATESARLAFEFLILTATRTSEVLRATWGEFDLDAKTWTIPADRMKAKREHRVPLAARAVEILEAAKGLSDGASASLVFPGREKKPLSNMVFLMTLRRMERQDITAHGFRSSFRDWASERTNTPQAVCEAALAHTVRDKTEAAYNRSDLFERRRKLMGAWAAFATAEPADVVSLHA